MPHNKFHRRIWTAPLPLAMAAVAFACSNPATASTLTWALPTLTFADGQTATGTFTVNQQLETLTNWNVQIVGGTNPTVTNLSFTPGGSCVVFCGEVIATGIPAPSSVDFRTPLASNQTFFELTLYFNAPLSAIFHPSSSEIPLNSSGTVDYEELTSPTIVTALQQVYLTNTGTGELTLTPEPATVFSFALALLSFAALLRVNGAKHRFTKPRPAV